MYVCMHYNAMISTALIKTYFHIFTCFSFNESTLVESGFDTLLLTASRLFESDFHKLLFRI